MQAAPERRYVGDEVDRYEVVPSGQGQYGRGGKAGEYPTEAAYHRGIQVERHVPVLTGVEHGPEGQLRVAPGAKVTIRNDGAAGGSGPASDMPS